MIPLRRLRPFTRALIMLALVGCAALGDEAPFPEVVATSGVGPFRRLEAEETPFRGAPPGRAIDLGRLGVDRASYAGETLFVGAAAPLESPPARNPSIRDGALDPDQFEPFSIYRLTPNPDEITFGDRSLVLSASEAWEGSFVAEPFALELPDGRVRLYYSAAGGIGVAEAPDARGTFTRVGSMAGLALANAAPEFAGPLRAPTVALFEDTFYLYADDGESIWVATSTDGLSFTPLDTIPETAALDPIAFPGPADPDAPAEIAYVNPGVIATTSPTGRTWIRLYVEVHLAPDPDDPSDESIIIATASADGMNFERALLPAIQGGDTPGHPTIRMLPDEVSLMYLSIARGSVPEQRVIVMAVTPGSTRFEAENP